MKILCCGDFHIRQKRPANRLDANYFDTIIGKIMQIFKAAKEHDVNFILQPGDVFDTHAVSDRVVRRTVKLFSARPVPLLSIPGQHDLIYHSKIWQNTPIGILDATQEGLKVLPENKFGMGEIHIYGAGWNDDIPQFDDPKAFNILLCHKLIVDTSTWKGNFTYEYDATQLLESTGYELIVSGDNHQTFTVNHSFNVLINAGSLMRTRIDQVEHKPCYFIFDTETREYTKHYLKVSSVSDILNLDKAKKEQEENIHLKEFVDHIEDQNGDDEELNFKKKLSTRMIHQKKQLGSGVINILKEVMTDDGNRKRDRT